MPIPEEKLTAEEMRDLFTRIQNATEALEEKVDKIISGETPVNTQLTGSIPEYGWVDGDTEPTPDGFAFGVKIDPITGEMTTMYWNGTAWAEVV